MKLMPFTYLVPFLPDRHTGEVTADRLRALLLLACSAAEAVASSLAGSTTACALLALSAACFLSAAVYYGRQKPDVDDT